MQVNRCRDRPHYQQSDEKSNGSEKQSFAGSLVELALVSAPNFVMLEDESKQTKEGRRRDRERPDSRTGPVHLVIIAVVAAIMRPEFARFMLFSF